MVSIVICSVNTDYQAQVKQNVEDTIGVPYELLIWDNRLAKKGICEVYNTMAAKAQFPYICFMHEDILFATNNWGKLLVHIFDQDAATGVIGVAGSKYKGKAWSGWLYGDKELDCINIIHRTNGQDEVIISPVNNRQPLYEVVCLDGVFMVTRKEVWEQIRYDDVLLKGFHLYDIDFSVRASKITKLVATTQIDIIHITPAGGDYGDNWVTETMRFHAVKSNYLPCVVKNMPLKNPEQHVAKTWLDALKNRPVSFPYRMKWILKQQLYKDPGLWYSILKFFLYRPLGLKTIHYFFKRR